MYFGEMKRIQSHELFVGDLSFFCTEQDLYELFQPFGRVLDIRIKKSDTKCRSLMFGFVKMESPEHAAQASSQLNGKLFMGRHLK
jgi:RNA recognition motif-containing protein